MQRTPPLATCVLVLLGAWASVQRAQPADWTGFLGGPYRTAAADERGLLPAWPADGPPLLWETTGLGYGYAEVLVVGGNVYTYGRLQKAGSLKCPDRRTGLARWKVAPPASELVFLEAQWSALPQQHDNGKQKADSV